MIDAMLDVLYTEKDRLNRVVAKATGIVEACPVGHSYLIYMDLVQPGRPQSQPISSKPVARY